MLAFAFATLASLRRKVEWGSGWMWPVPTLKTADGIRYLAVISDGVGSPRGSQLHHGVDIMYARRDAKDRPEYTRKPVNGVVNGTPGFFAPRGTPIVAARAGTIWSSGKTTRGGTVVIDHGKPFATYYTHMATLAFPDHHAGAPDSNPGATTHVNAGDIIGWMGADPMDAGHLRHLHFEVWHKGTTNEAVDPAPEMAHWPRPPWDWTP